jgi:hypothetical protein
VDEIGFDLCDNTVTEFTWSGGKRIGQTSVRFQGIMAASMKRQPSGIRRRVVSESRPTLLEG